MAKRARRAARREQVKAFLGYLTGGSTTSMGRILTAMAKKSAPASKSMHYEKLVATNPLVECKGATMPYTSTNGQMFS